MSDSVYRQAYQVHIIIDVATVTAANLTHVDL